MPRNPTPDLCVVFQEVNYDVFDHTGLGDRANYDPYSNNHDTPTDGLGRRLFGDYRSDLRLWGQNAWNTHSGSLDPRRPHGISRYFGKHYMWERIGGSATAIPDTRLSLRQLRPHFHRRFLMQAVGSCRLEKVLFLRGRQRAALQYTAHLRSSPRPESV